MLLELQRGITYGPVQSRRLGSSLGINILPLGRKVCSFNCLYCQYGCSRGISARGLHRFKFPRFSLIAEAVAHALKTLPQPPRYITFSGNGEPTLHPEFDKIVTGIIQLRDELAPRSRTAILSNSSTVHQPYNREILARLDVPIMKLDVGLPETFRAYNRPTKEIELEEIVQGLSELKNVTIQALFTGGPRGNFTEEGLEAWIGQVKKISPRLVQVYSLARSSPTSNITKLDRTELMRIQSRLGAEKIKANVY